MSESGRSIDVWEGSPAHGYARYEASTARAGAGQPRDRYWLHALLFLITLATTVHAGGILVGRVLAYEDLGAWWFVPDGLRFAVSLLLFLSVHEFGHYFAARAHGVDVSLPYYIPLPFVGIGTLGAVIRIRQPVPSLKVLFDIGAAGPLAGFVAALGLLIFAFATLPPPEMVFDLPGHEALKQHVEQFGTYPDVRPESEGEITLVVGRTLLYVILSQFVADAPPMYELYHYPLLFAGWLGLFFTALNLLPVGQLDGGHILYALFGRKWHGRLARMFVTLLLVSGAIGFAAESGPMLESIHPIVAELSWFVLAGILYFFYLRVYDRSLPIVVGVLGITMILAVLSQTLLPLLQEIGYSAWFIWTLLIVSLIKIDHPPTQIERPLTPGRKALAILCILIFVLCFSFRPLYIL